MKTSTVLLIGLIGLTFLVGLLIFIIGNFWAKPRSIIDMFYGFLFAFWMVITSEFVSAFHQALTRVRKDD